MCCLQGNRWLIDVSRTGCNWDIQAMEYFSGITTYAYDHKQAMFSLGLKSLGVFLAVPQIVSRWPSKLTLSPRCPMQLQSVRSRRTSPMLKKSVESQIARFGTNKKPAKSLKFWWLLIHPGKLTWNLKITCLKRKIIFQTCMTLGSMLIFRGVIFSHLFVQRNPRRNTPMSFRWLWLEILPLRSFLTTGQSLKNAIIKA